MDMEHNVARSTAAETGIELVDFIRLGDQVIGYANHSNQEMNAPNAINLAILYGIARYGAYLARALSDDEREGYIEDMSARYADMLREHFADPTLK